MWYGYGNPFVCTHQQHRESIGRKCRHISDGLKNDYTDNFKHKKPHAWVNVLLRICPYLYPITLMQSLQYYKVITSLSHVGLSDVHTVRLFIYLKEVKMILLHWKTWTFLINEFVLVVTEQEQLQFVTTIMDVSQHNQLRYYPHHYNHSHLPPFLSPFSSFPHSSAVGLSPRSLFKA